jgi:hypothetical protein
MCIEICFSCTKHHNFTLLDFFKNGKINSEKVKSTKVLSKINPFTKTLILRKMFQCS